MPGGIHGVAEKLILQREGEPHDHIQSAAVGGPGAMRGVNGAGIWSAFLEYEESLRQDLISADRDPQTAHLFSHHIGSSTAAKSLLGMKQPIEKSRRQAAIYHRDLPGKLFQLRSLGVDLAYLNRLFEYGETALDFEYFDNHPTQSHAWMLVGNEHKLVNLAEVENVLDATSASASIPLLDRKPRYIIMKDDEAGKEKRARDPSFSRGMPTTEILDVGATTEDEDSDNNKRLTHGIVAANMSFSQFESQNQAPPRC